VRSAFWANWAPSSGFTGRDLRLHLTTAGVTMRPSETQVRCSNFNAPQLSYYSSNTP
jgi:hypothetical protein